MFGLDFIKKLKPCKWRYNQPLDDGVEHFGFIAQEVDEVANHKEYAFVKFENEYYRISLGEFIGPLTKAVQELDDRLAKVEADIARSKRTK